MTLAFPPFSIYSQDVTASRQPLLSQRATNGDQIFCQTVELLAPADRRAMRGVRFKRVDLANRAQFLGRSFWRRQIFRTDRKLDAAEIEF
jgi:hypothetical protein